MWLWTSSAPPCSTCVEQGSRPPRVDTATLTGGDGQRIAGHGIRPDRFLPGRACEQRRVRPDPGQGGPPLDAGPRAEPRPGGRVQYLSGDPVRPPGRTRRLHAGLEPLRRLDADLTPAGG